MNFDKEKIRRVVNQEIGRDCRCFYPECNQPAIRSHSQSKESSLRNIAENGHVYRLAKDLLNERKKPSDWFEYIGLSKASVYKGFCKEHDGKFFKNIDEPTLNLLSPENLHRLAFRTFSYEVRTKEKFAFIFDKLSGHNRGNTILEAHLDGVRNNLEVTTPHYHEKFFDLLFGDKNHKFISYAFKVESNLSISTSTVMNPDMKNSGDFLRGQLHEPLSCLFFDVIPQVIGGYILISFFSDIERLVKKFLSDVDIVDIIFNHCEELHFRPSFYESLNDSARNRIIKAQKPWVIWDPVDCKDIVNLKVSSPIEIR